MKKFLLLLSMSILLAGTASAQISYGVKAGVNLPTLSEKASYTDADEQKDYDELQQKTKTTTNFYVTGYVKFPVAPNAYIQPGLSLQGKGGKIEESDSGTDWSWVYTRAVDFLAIDIPVDFVYHVPAGSGNVLLGVGPYVGFNISGKGKYKMTDILGGDVETDETTATLKFGSGEKKFTPDGRNKVIVENAFKALDYGLNFQAGYKLDNGFLVNAQYGVGLANLNNEKEIGAEFSTRNRIISFGVGFEF